MNILRVFLLLALIGPALGAAAPAAGQSASVLALQRDLDAIVGAVGAAVRAGVLVVSREHGDTLYSRNPDVSLTPASNMKLYSTGAALYYLGPSYRFSTYLLADGSLGEGSIEGDVVLYGTGDPTIAGRMLESGASVLGAFADSLEALGVRVVTGDVVGDGSYYDDAWIGPGWQRGDLMAGYGAPVGALSYGENLVTLRVQPGAVGGAARIVTAPATRGLAVENRVRTVASGATSVRFEHGDSTIVVSGQIRRGAGAVSRTLPVVDPANYAAAALAAILEARGIRVEGGVRSIRRREDSRFGVGRGGAGGGGQLPRVLAVHLSPPLDEIAAVTNHVSQNLYAEALMKAAGRAAVGTGSFAGGALAIERLVTRETGADPAGLLLVDGSGLSRTNLVTARATIQLLDFMSRSDVWDAFFESLPQAAAPRGLRRMFDTAAAGNLRAKTGTIRTVSALSGYVDAADGEPLLFSIMINGIPSTARAKQIEDRIGARIARFRRE